MPVEPFKFDGALDPEKGRQILALCEGRVLDVGCNTGELVGFLHSRGLAAEGIDINPEFILQAKAKFSDCNFHLGQDLSIFREGEFDTVVAWDVLEHIPDDVHALSEFLRIAKSRVVLSVPKEDEISLPFSRVTYRPYVDPTHCHYYTEESLGRLAASVGAKISQIEHAARIKPLLAYAKLGIPFRILWHLDRLFWRFAANREIFHHNLVAVILKS